MASHKLPFPPAQLDGITAILVCEILRKIAAEIQEGAVSSTIRADRLLDVAEAIEEAYK